MRCLSSIVFPLIAAAGALVFMVHCSSEDAATPVATPSKEAGPKDGSTSDSSVEGGGGAAGAAQGGSAGQSGTGGGVAGAGNAGAGNAGGNSGTAGSAGQGGGCDDPDKDGFGTGSACKGPDCAPTDPAVYPGAQEVCNGTDDDCNGAADDGITCPTPKPHLWVFVLAGQSNMVGLGFNSELPTDEQGPVDGATIYYNSSIHPNPNTKKWMPLGPGFGVLADRFGPELSFGRRVRQLWPSRNVGIIKVAEGGTGLYDRWKASTGDLYKLLISETAAQLKVLEQDWRPQLVGFVWMQGESDALQEGTAKAYQNNLTQFLIQQRVDEGLPIIATTAGLISAAGGWPFTDTVRNATALVSTTVGQMNVVETQDLPTQPADIYHYTSDSYLTLGRRFAEAQIAQLPEQWHVPGEFSSAQGDSDWTYRERINGASKLMTWDPANNRWSNADSTAFIGDGWMHPGPLGYSELGWWAPYAGNVSLQVEVTDGDAAGGDGVVVEVLHNDTQLWSQEIPNGGKVTHAFTASVVQGQELRFRTSAGALQNPFYDTTLWKIDVQMTVEQ